MAICLGDKVTDPVSGLSGIAWARIEYLTGETEIDVMLPSQDGKRPDHYSIAEERLMAPSIKALQEIKGLR